MYNQVLFTTLCLLAVSTPSLSYDCSNVLEIENVGLLNYLANVTFEAPHHFDGEWVMDLGTDVEFTFLGGWAVWVQSNPELGKGTFKSRESVNVTAGEPITFRFRISWFIDEPKPEIVSLVWDGAQICKDNGETLSQVKAQRRRREESKSLAKSSNGRRRRFRVNF